jgi:hypothetical protein
MRELAEKIDMNVLEEIIKLAEKAMVGGMGKKKPDLAVMEIDIEKKPMEDETAFAEKEPKESLEMAEDEMEDDDDMSDMELEELMKAYKTKRG